MKNRYYLSVISVCCVLLLLAACKAGKGDKAPRHLNLPDKAETFQLYSNKAPEITRNGQFAIITYYDTGGCTPCQLKELGYWHKILRIIKEDSLSVDFIPIFRTSKDDPDLQHALKTSGFNMPVICDSLGTFEKNNALSDNHSMHTFLVNRDNKVLIVGTPIFNDKHWEAYVDQIKTGK